jgi:hypothetical protein
MRKLFILTTLVFALVSGAAATIVAAAIYSQGTTAQASWQNHTP